MFPVGDSEPFDSDAAGTASKLRTCIKMQQFVEKSHRELIRLEKRSKICMEGLLWMELA